MIISILLRKVENLGLGGERLQINHVYYRIESAIDQVLLVLADVHIRHSPVDILCEDLLLQLPVERVVGIVKDYVRLARCIEYVSLACELSAIYRAVRTWNLAVELREQTNHINLVVPCLEGAPHSTRRRQ